MQASTLESLLFVKAALLAVIIIKLPHSQNKGQPSICIFLMLRPR